MNVGTRVGSYEIIAAIGAGGMGEVYRARDPKLSREVAIKVLPEAFAGDAARMARFQREAKVLASLSHPNIATIYGLEDSGSTRALVMELVEGPTLADRIKQGPIPVDEAIRIARQIADALEYAHERGIIHRDLKPANIKVAADDTVKVLDFGLAKALEGDPASIDISTSPTISRMATMQGVLLGTAAYMSPEQAKAKPVDRRADIWAFGCVLYEMLTGKMAFHGDTVTDTLASIIKEEPDWSRLPANTPMRVRVLLQRCLQKDVRQRLQAMGDARISLDEVLSGAPEGAAALAAGAPFWRRALPWAAGLLTGALISALLVWKLAAPASPLAEPVRFEIPLPQGVSGGAISLDGRQFAFNAMGSDGIRRIWIRSLDSLEARPLAGTESVGLAEGLIWSPDSRFIAFPSVQSGAGGSSKLLKIALSGGPAQKICEFTGNSMGGSWNSDGVIIFGSDHGLMQVSAVGGSAQPLTVTNGVESDISVQFLPNGRRFIYSHNNAGEKSGVYVGSLDAKPEEQGSKRLLDGETAAVYVPPSGHGTGYLLFGRGSSLVAQAFDVRREELNGDVSTVVDGGGHGNVASIAFSASANGALTYAITDPPPVTLAWYDRQGKAQSATGTFALDTAVTVSPDGKRAILFSTDTSDMRMWLVDFARGTRAPFTFQSSPAGDQGGDAVWSPDGSRVIFAANVGGIMASLYEKPVSGATDEILLLKSAGVKHPRSWSPDGRFLFYDGFDPKTGKSAIWALPVKGDKNPIPVLGGGFNVGSGQISPDGHWIAYGSDESGAPELFVREISSNPEGSKFTLGGGWQISNAGGVDPRWRGDGKEMYYRALDGRVMAVEVNTKPTFQAGPPREVFQGPPLLFPPGASMPSGWGFTGDGRKFLFSVFAGHATPPAVTVVLNWQAALKK